MKAKIKSTGEIAKDLMMALEYTNTPEGGWFNPEVQAQYAVRAADALIAELKKGGSR